MLMGVTKFQQTASLSSMHSHSQSTAALLAMQPIRFDFQHLPQDWACSDLCSCGVQDQQTELERFSDAVSSASSPNFTAGLAAESASQQQQQQQQQASLGNGSSTLHSQSSALSWSQRQQLRRTSAVLRHAAASRHMPHQEGRLPSGWAFQLHLGLVNDMFAA